MSLTPTPVFGFMAIVVAIVSSVWSKELGVLTQHNDNQRTGSYLEETQLTPESVDPSTFDRLYSLAVDGQIGAQPLFVSGVLINGSQKDVLYVATRKNKVYAFDVGSPSLSPYQRLLWMVELRDQRRGTDHLDGLGAEELPGMDRRFPGDKRTNFCHQTHGPVGISSTPVIDVSTNTMYVVYRTASPFEKGLYDAKHYLRKIDIRTHATLAEQEIQPDREFDPNKVLNRTGLLLVNGVIYMGFGAAVCDNGGGESDNGKKPHGWVLAFDANDLKLIASLNTTPNTILGGIWQSGAGLASDRNGFVYAFTGNNQNEGEEYILDHDPQHCTELSDAILKLRLDRQNHVIHEEHFTAHNWYRLDTGERFPKDPQATLPCQPVFPCPSGVQFQHVNGDSDIASGGPVVLANGLVIGGGKQGRLYVMEPQNMQAKQGFQAFYNSWHPGISPCDYDQDQAFGPNIHGDPVVWHPEGESYSLVYGMPEKDYLKAFRAYDNGHVDERPIMTTVEAGIRSPRGMPGGFLSLSANGGRNGILWVSAPVQDAVDAVNTSGTIQGRLMAFDALRLTELWRSQDTVSFAKFVPPTIAAGKVFRVAYHRSGAPDDTEENEVIVYGLRSGRGHSGGSTVLASRRPVTAIWRNPDHLDLFMTSRDDRDGSVLSTSWEAICPPVQNAPAVARGWRGWFPIHSNMDKVPDSAPLPKGFNFSIPAGQPVTAVRHDAIHLDLFVTSKEGHVMSIVWEPPCPQESLGSGWKAWFPIRPDSGVAAPGKPVTAVWRNPDHLDLFMTDRDGHVKSIYFEGAAWQPRWFTIGMDSDLAAPGQPVTAVWRNPDHLDLFVTDRDGHVKSIYFENGAWQPAWFPIRPDSGVAAPGQPVTAVWRNPDHLDLFMADRDGHVKSIYFEGAAWQPRWFTIGMDSDLAAPGQLVTALWSNPNHLDLFMTAMDGRVMSTFFDENHWLKEWFSI